MNTESNTRAAAATRKMNESGCAFCLNWVPLNVAFEFAKRKRDEHELFTRVKPGRSSLEDKVPSLVWRGDQWHSVTLFKSSLPAGCSGETTAFLANGTDNDFPGHLALKRGDWESTDLLRAMLM
jgi:hypothetical protein